MRIAFTTESGEVHNLEVDSQMELENVKALIEAEVLEFIFLLNFKILSMVHHL